MLVLSRKVGENILIGKDIVVRVLTVKGDKVRLGIEAPREVPVHRNEIYDKIHAKPNDDLTPSPNKTI